MAKLVLLNEGLTGRTYELKQEKTTVGRVADNTFEIPEASVSSHHCEIFLRGKEVVVKDLDSTNGTFINGEKITEATLKPGQILRLGTLEMRLETGAGAPSPAPAPAQKKPLDQTRVIPQGVKLDELEGARPPVNFEKKGFGKKSTKGSTYFIIGAIVLGVLLVGALIYIALKK